MGVSSRGGLLRVLGFREEDPEPVGQIQWETLTQAKVPIDGRALWLAQFERVQLRSMERLIPDAAYARHLAFSTVGTAYNDLIEVLTLSPRELEGWRIERGATTRTWPTLPKFWNKWGLRNIPQKVPPGFREALGFKNGIVLPPLPEENSPFRSVVAAFRYLTYAAVDPALCIDILDRWCQES